MAVLYAGGESFIKGSSNTARIFNIRPLVIGVVVVAFATSAPEFCVSILAAIRKSRDLAIGNIVGSCICNIGLVLGLSALIKPIQAEKRLLKRELPILLAVTVGLFLVSLDNRISRPEALILLVAFFAFIFSCLKGGKDRVEDLGIATEKKPDKLKSFIFLGAGLVGLLGGAYLMVNSAVFLARYFGISELVIGLTVVAIGTSLPELAASLIASRRGEGEISIGNVIGSNIFNILGVIGVVCLIRPITVDPNIFIVSMPLLLLITFALWPVMKIGQKITRFEGLILLVVYTGYLTFLIKK